MFDQVDPYLKDFRKNVKDFQNKNVKDFRKKMQRIFEKKCKGFSRKL